MDRLLAYYCVDVRHSEVGGAKHLEMLQILDQLAGFEPTLTAEEKGALDAADRMLAEHAHLFHQELQRFIDLAAYRRERGFRQSAGGGTSMSSGVPRAVRSSPLRAPDREGPCSLCSTNIPS
jgi:hypothetical protein